MRTLDQMYASHRMIGMTHPQSWRAVFLIMWAVLFTSCGGGNNATSTNPTGQPGGSARHAYVSNYGGGSGQTLTGFAVSSTNGNLLPFDLSALKVPPGPLTLGTDGQGKFVYVGSQGGLISAYSYSPLDGGLTQIGGSPYGAGQQVTFLTIDSSSKYVFSVDNTLSTIWPFTISATTGALTPIASTSKVPAYGVTPNPPLTATVDPFVHYLYVAMGSAGTEVFQISNSGLLDAGTILAMGGANAEFIAIERTGRFAYVADGTSGIATYFIDPSTGNLVALAPTPVPTGSKPNRIILTPDSKYMYVINQGDGTVSQFALNPNGGLTSIGTNLACGIQPATGTVDAGGTFLYVVNQGSASVSIFRISAIDGTLTAQAPASSGPSPSSIVVVP
ncbi:MAG: beta-propeller fold lactonase family protein [Candidatus Korobacteraceae bacterium]